MLSIGDYQDTQEVISGSVTRKVGTMILDGTEDWVNYSSGNGVFYFDSDATFGLPSNCLCTHYNGVESPVGASTMPYNSIKCGFATDVRYNHRVYLRGAADTSLEDLTTFLATQYANGTPVILLYPLATPTTETVTAQPLNIQQGTNIVEVTEASLNDLEIEVKYKGK